MPAKFDPNIHHRKSIRLRGYDYSQAGAYFVTIVTFQRAGLFGEIINGEMVLNETGKIIQKWWDDIPIHFPGVETGAFVIMPNHVHGIIILHDRRGAVPAPFVSGGENQGGNVLNDKEQGGETLGQIVAYFKYQSTKEINALTGAGVVTKLWQRNYYERIIRNDREMDAIWRYIENNPANWAQDSENIHP
jgi:REP element-mobilizing transposase RayT